MTAVDTWDCVDLAAAPAAGPVAFSRDVGPDSLLAAYRHGLYPFPANGLEQRLLNELSYSAEVAAGRIAVLSDPDEAYSTAWYSPDPRPLIGVHDAHLSRSLRQKLRTKVAWTTTLDACFERVVARCGAGRRDRWLTGDLVAGLLGLHERGHAHSVEVWHDDELVGGVFGVRVGVVFSADSQFTGRSGAGQVAIADLARRFARAGGRVIDAQQDSEHVRRLGARPVSRSEYLHLLGTPDSNAELPAGPLPARRLAE